MLEIWENMVQYVFDDTRSFIVQFVFWSLLGFFLYILVRYFKEKQKKLNTTRLNSKWAGYKKKIYYFSGLEFILQKFVPDEKNKFPTGWIWFLGLYFAGFTVASQKYELQLSRLDYRLGIFSTSVANKGLVCGWTIEQIVSNKIPRKPKLWKPTSVIDSLFFPLVFNRFYDELQIFMPGSLCMHKPSIHPLYQSKYAILNLWRNNLDRALLNHGYFRKLTLNYANLKNSYLNRSNFTSTYFIGSDFSEADLTDANFEEAILLDCNFQGTIFKNTNLQGATIAGAINLKAEQLIESSNLYGLKCPVDIITKLKEYACFEMIKKKPEDWSKELILNRALAIKPKKRIWEARFPQFFRE